MRGGARLGARSPSWSTKLALSTHSSFQLYKRCLTEPREQAVQNRDQGPSTEAYEVACVSLDEESLLPIPDPQQEAPGSPSASSHSLFSCHSCLSWHPASGSWVASPQASLGSTSDDGGGSPNSGAASPSPPRSSRNWGQKAGEGSSCGACASGAPECFPWGWACGDLSLGSGSGERGGGAASGPHWMRGRRRHWGCPCPTRAWVTSDAWSHGASHAAIGPAPFAPTPSTEPQDPGAPGGNQSSGAAFSPPSDPRVWREMAVWGATAGGRSCWSSAKPAGLWPGEAGGWLCVPQPQSPGRTGCCRGGQIWPGGQVAEAGLGWGSAVPSPNTLGYHWGWEGERLPGSLAPRECWIAGTNLNENKNKNMQNCSSKTHSSESGPPSATLFSVNLHLPIFHHKDAHYLVMKAPMQPMRLPLPFTLSHPKSLAGFTSLQQWVHWIRWKLGAPVRPPVQGFFHHLRA